MDPQVVRRAWDLRSHPMATRRSILCIETVRSNSTSSARRYVLFVE